MAITLINGKAYDYTQIQITLLGVPLVDVRSISYSMEQDKENIFGLGEKPVARGRGTKNTTGSIELGMTDVEAIRSASPTGSLLDLDLFDFVIVFANTQQVRTHIVKDIDFTTDGMEGSVGDTSLARSFDFTASDIIYK